MWWLILGLVVGYNLGFVCGWVMRVRVHEINKMTFPPGDY